MKLEDRVQCRHTFVPLQMPERDWQYLPEQVKDSIWRHLQEDRTEGRRKARLRRIARLVSRSTGLAEHTLYDCACMFNMTVHFLFSAFVHRQPEQADQEKRTKEKERGMGRLAGLLQPPGLVLDNNRLGSQLSRCVY